MRLLAFVPITGPFTIIATYKGPPDADKDAKIRNAMQGKDGGSGYDLTSKKRDIVRYFDSKGKLAGREVLFALQKIKKQLKLKIEIYDE